MTRLEYELLREAQPHLRLPKFRDLTVTDIQRLENHTRESLIGARTAIILGREYLTDGR